MTLLLLPFVVLNFYVYPVYDDYWYADVVRTNGFVGAVKWWWMNASGGRILSTCIISLSHFTIHSIILHRLLIVFISFLFGFSVWLLFRKLFDGIKVFSNYFRSTILLIFLVCFFYTLSGISQLFYWLSGAATYLLGLSFLNIVGVLLLGTSDLRNEWKYTLILFFSLAACSTSELAGLCVAGLLIISVFLNKNSDYNFREHILRSVNIYIFLSVILFLYFIVLKTPGNGARFQMGKSLSPDAGNISFAMHCALISTLKFIYNLLIVKRLALVVVPIVVFIFSCNVDSKWEIDFAIIPKPKSVILVQLILLFLLFFTLFTYSFSTGLVLPIQRILLFVHFFWVLNIIMISMCFGFILKKMFVYIHFPNRYFVYSLVCYFMLIFSADQNNARKLVIDFKNGNLSKYEIYMRTQRMQFQKSNNLMLKEHRPPPKPLIYVWDLSDENYNTRYFLYYRNVLCDSIQ
jgi:hypothetical protein